MQLLPEVRGGKVGSKKRYAGLLVEADGSERIEFVGLESVRRDWTIRQWPSCVAVVRPLRTPAGPHLN